MSNAKRCDRCGAFYQPEAWEHGDIAVKKKIKKYEILFYDYYFVDDDIDLCPGCSAFIKDWLTKKEN